MPASPDLAQDLAKNTLQIYLDAEQILLERIARRLARGLDDGAGYDLKLLEIQALRREAERIVESLEAGALDAVADAVRIGYNRGVAAAGAELTGQTTATAALAFGRVNDRAVQALVDRAQQRTRDLTLQILRSVLDVFRSLVGEASAQVLTGALTRREASARVVAQAGRAGLRFVDRSGRPWEIGSYAEMATRTSAGQAAVQGHVDRLAEQGHDLVIVSNAPEECKLCRPWEGKVLSLSGRTRGRVEGARPIGTGSITVRVAGTLDDAVRAGLQHPNCRHSVSLYIPGVTKPVVSTADPEGDAQRQRQRELERRVRAAKRATQTLKAARQQAVADSGRKALPATDPIERAYRQAVARQRVVTAAHDEYVEATGRKRLGYRLSTTAR